jgi:hypothetical protein
MKIPYPFPSDLAAEEHRGLHLDQFVQRRVRQRQCHGRPQRGAPDRECRSRTGSGSCHQYAGPGRTRELHRHLDPAQCFRSAVRPGSDQRPVLDQDQCTARRPPPQPPHPPDSHICASTHLPVIPILLHPVASQVLVQVSAPASGVGHAVANCPSGSIVTGGGFAGSSNMLVYSTFASGNGWEVDAQNLSASPQGLNAYAECLSHTSGTTQQVIYPGDGGCQRHWTRCYKLPVWQRGHGRRFCQQLKRVGIQQFGQRQWLGGVWSQNTSSTTQPLNAYAICLSGTSGTTQSLVNQVSAAGNGIGQSVKACPSATYLTGGGYAGNTEPVCLQRICDLVPAGRCMHRTLPGLPNCSIRTPSA